MTLEHNDFNVIETMYLFFTGIDENVTQGDRVKAKNLYNKLLIEDQVLRGVLDPDQRSLGEKYKEYIRDADRLSNEQILQRYGTTIDEFRNRVSDFKDALKAGTATEPNIPRPT